MVLGITKSSNGIHGDKEGRSAIKNKFGIILIVYYDDDCLKSKFNGFNVERSNEFMHW